MTPSSMTSARPSCGNGESPSMSRRFDEDSAPAGGQRAGCAGAQARASTIGRNFTRVSSSSVSGSLPATMPAPACATTGIVSVYAAWPRTARRRSARSAARSPTRRRRSRRPSRPGRRSGRGRTARAGGSARSRHPSACPRPPRSGCSDATRSSADAWSASSPATSVARCHRFGSSSANGSSSARSALRVRGERVEHALHGVAVLVEVLAAVREGEGCRGVVVRVGSARERPGEHARGDAAARDGDERLGARADQAVDGEGPGVGVARRQRADEPAQVGARGHGADEVAREHDLADLARRDRVEAGAHGGLVALGVERAGAERRRPVRAVRDRARRRASATSAIVERMRVIHARPSRRPTIALRDDEPARRARPRVEGEGAERDEARCRGVRPGRRSRRRRRCARHASAGDAGIRVAPARAPPRS